MKKGVGTHTPCGSTPFSVNDSWQLVCGQPATCWWWI